ncbi:MAG: T9SS type A sorting domain-containing protein [Bacteroidales bacterium]|nr:MAG: T9SS type A sorting domain-containing protein [Bacteroidales bacterium]
MKRLFFIFVIIAIVCVKGIGQSDTTIQILPENPTISDDIELVIYKCSMDLSSYELINDTIVFKVTTDSRIMIAAICLVTYDTVDVGKLNQGDWTLLFYVIDKARKTADSIVYTDTMNFHVYGSEMRSTENEVSNWRIFPNPANEIITIENSDAFIPNNDVYLTITDLQGKVMLRKHLSDFYSRVDISDLKKGCYLIRVSDNNRILYRQILIK